MLIFEVDIPPRLSDLYTNMAPPKKGRVKTKKYRDYQRATIREIMVQLLGQRKKWPRAPFDLTVWLYFRAPLKPKVVPPVRDSDNRAKAAQDTLAKALGFNDSCVFDLHVRKREVLAASLDYERCVLVLTKTKMEYGPERGPYRQRS